jgi:hypothetical protein
VWTVTLRMRPPVAVTVTGLSGAMCWLPFTGVIASFAAGTIGVVDWAAPDVEGAQPATSKPSATNKIAVIVGHRVIADLLPSPAQFGVPRPFLRTRQPLIELHRSPVANPIAWRFVRAAAQVLGRRSVPNRDRPPWNVTSTICHRGVRMIELVRSNDPVLISFVTSLLAEARIKHSVTDTHMNIIDGSIGAIPSRIMVAEDHLDEARRLVTEAGVQIEA